jgi:hypothetical protein
LRRTCLGEYSGSFVILCGETRGANAAAGGPSHADGRPLQLRDVAAALRKADDVKGVLRALGCLEALVRDAPDELPAVAPEARFRVNGLGFSGDSPDELPTVAPEGQRPPHGPDAGFRV